MSGLPSPSDTKPKPRVRLNHFTFTRTQPEVASTAWCVRTGRSTG